MLCKVEKFNSRFYNFRMGCLCQNLVLFSPRGLGQVNQGLICKGLDSKGPEENGKVPSLGTREILSVG